jgi:cell division protein FtsZ
MTSRSFEYESESLGTQVCVLTVGFESQVVAEAIKASVPRANVIALSPSDHKANRIRTALSSAHFVIIAITDSAGVGQAITIAQLAKSRGISPLTIWGGAENAPAALATQADSWVSSGLTIAGASSAMSLHESQTAENSLVRMQTLVSDLWKLINVTHFVGVDIEDVKAVTGRATPGRYMFGQASGPGRAMTVTDQLFGAGTFQHAEFRKARGVLVCISAGKGTLTLNECKQVMNVVRSVFSTNADVVYGTAVDDALGGELRVLVLATDFSGT